MIAVKGLFMEKWLCIGSMGVAGLLILLFVLAFVYVTATLLWGPPTGCSRATRSR